MVPYAIIAFMGRNMNGKLRCAIDNALQTRNMKEYACRDFIYVITTLVPLEAFCGIMDNIMMNIQYDYETGGLLDEKHIS